LKVSLKTQCHGCPGIIAPPPRRSNRLVGLGDFYTSRGSQSLLDVTVDGELTGSQSTDHEKTGTDTTVAAADTELLGDLDQTAGGSLTGKTLGLVDLGEHGIGGLGNDGGSHTGNETGAQVVDGLHAIGGLALVDDGVDGLVDLLEDDELGHGVGNPGRMLDGEKNVKTGNTYCLNRMGPKPE
jgi:hypothetical protein